MNLTATEKELYHVVRHGGNSFKVKLFELICKADIDNQERLAMGFPEFVKAVKRYQNESGYWDKIRKHFEK
jgi:hypothetical protein